MKLVIFLKDREEKLVFYDVSAVRHDIVDNSLTFEYVSKSNKRTMQGFFNVNAILGYSKEIISE